MRRLLIGGVALIVGYAVGALLFMVWFGRFVG